MCKGENLIPMEIYNKDQKMFNEKIKIKKVYFAQHLLMNLSLTVLWDNANDMT
jgi:hypothetical protein